MSPISFIGIYAKKLYNEGPIHLRHCSFSRLEPQSEIQRLRECFQEPEGGKETA